jgi:hypothetical protein
MLAQLALATLDKAECKIVSGLATSLPPITYHPFTIEPFLYPWFTCIGQPKGQ